MQTPFHSPPSESRKIPPGQQLVAPGKWPVIGEREPAVCSAPWSLNVFGKVEQASEFSLDEIRALPQTSLTIDIHCVTRWSKLDVQFSGVLLKDLLPLVKPNSEARFISFLARSVRNHSTSLSIDSAIEHNTIIALEVDGNPIEPGHGGPLRNIVPGRYFYKSVKWLDRIELLTNDRLGFWEAESGYHNEADPWTEQRYMAPTIDRREATKLIQSRDFSNRDLRSIDATERNLENLNATGASLRDANFTRANLANADFSNANLSNAHFRNSNLKGAQFTDADLEGADFSAADLRGTNFSGCSLIGASFCTEENGILLGANIDKTTLLPDSVLEPLFETQVNFVKQQIRRQ